MKKSINLEELMLRQYDEVLNSKDRLEAKAASYLAANALILAVLATFISILYDSKPQGFQSFIVLDMITFFIGLVNLLICIFVFLPRKLWSFNSEKLLEVYCTKEVSDDELLRQNEKFIYFNKKVIESVRRGYVAISIGLLVQIIGFILVSIFFFKII